MEEAISSKTTYATKKTYETASYPVFNYITQERPWLTHLQKIQYLLQFNDLKQGLFLVLYWLH